MFFNNAVQLPIFIIILKVIYDVSCTTSRDYATDTGNNFTIPCNGLSKLTNVENLMWVFQRGSKELSRHSVNDDGALVLSYVDVNDTGVYTCTVDINNSNDSVVVVNANLTVRTKPPPLVNVTVHLSTILGLIYWDVAGDGGYPIIHFTAEYRPAQPPEGDTELEEWHPISPNRISPNARQIDVYHLMPNSSYWFRVFAYNNLGNSTPVEALGHTLYSDTEKELARLFLTGVENFDTRIWVAAVSIVMGTLCVLTVGTCLLLYRECRVPNESDEEQDVMELVPNIILNPGFVDGQSRNEGMTPAAVMIRSNGKYSCANGSAEPRKV